MMIKIALGMLLGAWLIMGSVSAVTAIQERRIAKKLAKAKIKEYAAKYVDEHEIEE